MSMGALVLPAAGALLLALFSVTFSERLHPRVAAPLLTAVSTLAAASTLGALALVATAFLAGSPSLTGVLGWCRDLLPHDRVPTPVGAAAVAALVASVASVIASDRRRRLARRWPRSHVDGDVEVLKLDEPVAFALPGRPGRIIVSSGMLGRLSPPQRAALVAHERAHLAGRHHRYLTPATVASAAVPMLRPLADRVRFATERSADEAAATEIGSRRVVADAIARAALGSSASVHGAAAMATSGVAARVTALLSPPPSPRHRLGTTVTAALAVAAGVLGAAVQLHHAGTFAAHLCPPGWPA